MSVANSGVISRVFEMLWNGKHVRAAETFVRRHSGNTLFYMALATYAVLWMLYFTVSNASVDIHFDLSEASVWAEKFAFGYKHPPMTAWLFILWFSVFPRADWAAYLLAVTTIAITFIIIWRLLCDYLDKERALVGIAALMLVPLFTFQASRLNANTVMMPFWAAALLFYLRARRNLKVPDAILAGAFASLTFLGKYWAIYLITGIAIASLIGRGTRRFWHSPVPYLMAASAAIIVAPYIYWFATEHIHATQHFMAASVMTDDAFGTALIRSISYLGGAPAYVVVPLIFLVTLQPKRAARADILWPADRDRQQAHLLFLLPLVLPALANLAFPHRLTALWTYPNWALLPVVLFGSPLVTVRPVGVARAGLVALAVSLAAVMASPYLAYLHLKSKREWQDAHFRQVADEVARLSTPSVQLIAGSREIVQGLPFYLPQSHPIEIPSRSDPAALADIGTNGLVIICSSADEPCRSASTAIAGPASRSTDVTFTRTFLAIQGPPASYHITVIPATVVKLDERVGPAPITSSVPQF
jgi:4-amino-4-deoxy-L-arabinose transferase-like glycosyltransferase